MESEKTILQLNKDEAIKLYPTAAPEFKTMLESSFGKATFSKKITDRVKTIYDVFEIVKPTADQKILLNYYGKDRKMIGAKHLMLIEMIAEALNEDSNPDWWTDTSVYKYYPWFDYQTGFGFSRSFYVYWCSATACGSRLCFKSAELARYAWAQFKDIYIEFLTK